MWLDKLIDWCAPRVGVRENELLDTVQGIAKNVEIMKLSNQKRLERVEKYRKELAMVITVFNWYGTQLQKVKRDLCLV